MGATFACPGCGTSLTTDAKALPGLCPVCRVVIAELPNLPLSLLPLASAAVEQTGVLLSLASPESASVALASGDPAGGNETPISRRPDANRIHRSGNFSFRPQGPEDIQDRSLEFERQIPKDAPHPGSPSTAISRPKFPVKTLGVAAALFLILATIVGGALLMRGNSRQQTAAPATPIKTLRENLNKGALETLQAALGTHDPATIAAYVIGGEAMIPAIQERLQAGVPFPRLTEVDLVSDVPMSDADVRRGMSGLLYEAAPVDALSLDSPLLSAEMASGVVGLGLLEGAAVIESRTKPAPRQALALFARRNNQQLLDWDLFTQTWDRTLLAFGDGSLGDGPMVFRAILSLDKPVFANGERVDHTIIRVQDPLHSTDLIRVKARSFDAAELLLRPSEEELGNDPAAAMKPRSATVSLKRNNATGEVSIDSVICWEFLGLGGVEGNTGS